MIDFNSLPDDCLISSKELVPVIGRSYMTLARERMERKGIPFVRISRSNVKYRVGDVRAWIAERTVPTKSA